MGFEIPRVIIKNRSYQRSGNFRLSYSTGCIYRTTQDRAVSVMVAL